MTEEKKKPADRTSSKRKANARAKRDHIAHVLGWPGSWESLGTAVANGVVKITIIKNSVE